jgi:hypothetical protein
LLTAFYPSAAKVICRSVVGRKTSMADVVVAVYAYKVYFGVPILG